VNSTIKTVLFWAVIVISAFLLWQVVKTGTNAQKEKEIGFSEFLAYVDQSNIQDVTFSGQEAKGKIKNPDSLFHTTVPVNYPDMYKKLTEKNVPYSFKDISNGTWPSWLFQLLPLVLLGALWFFMIRQMQTGGNKALSFGKSRARLLSMQQKKITFKDVAGVEEAKEELKEIIEFLREAQKFQKLGGRIPKGVLLRRTSRNGKDLAGARGGGRSECSVLFHLGIGLCRNVRGRRRKPRARLV
jgi:cell division protease FtsH